MKEYRLGLNTEISAMSERNWFDAMIRVPETDDDGNPIPILNKYT